MEILSDIKTSLSSLFDLHSEMSRALQDSQEVMQLLVSAPRPWAQLYERPFTENVAIAAIAFGLNDSLKTWASLPPHELHKLRINLLAGEFPETAMPHGLTLGDVIALTTSLVRNLISKQAYGLYLNELVGRVKNQWSEDAFLKAVRVDRAVLTCPTFATVLMLAELTSDQEFLGKVASAMKEPPKTWNAEKGAFRVSLQLMEDTGAFDWLNQESAYRILHLKTGLYSGSKGEPPDARSLWTRIQRWRGLTKTKNRGEMSSQTE